MSYGTIEAAFLTRLRAYASGATFTADTSSRGDYDVMDSSAGVSSAVVVQAAPSRYRDTDAGRGRHGATVATHTIGIDLFVKRRQGRGGDGDSYTTMVDLSDAVIAYLDQYPTLGALTNLERIELIEASRILILRDRPHAYQRLTYRAIETVPIVLANGEHL